MRENTLYGPVANVHNGMYAVGGSDIGMNVIRGALNLLIHLLVRYEQHEPKRKVLGRTFRLSYSQAVRQA